MLVVKVELLNDDVESVTLYGEGETVGDAIDFATDEARRLTGDDSFTMNEWTAA